MRSSINFPDHLSIVDVKSGNKQQYSLSQYLSSPKGQSGGKITDKKINVNQGTDELENQLKSLLYDDMEGGSDNEKKAYSATSPIAPVERENRSRASMSSLAMSMTPYKNSLSEYMKKPQLNNCSPVKPSVGGKKKQESDSEDDFKDEIGVSPKKIAKKSSEDSMSGGAMNPGLKKYQDYAKFVGKKLGEKIGEELKNFVAINSIASVYRNKAKGQLGENADPDKVYEKAKELFLKDINNAVSDYKNYKKKPKKSKKSTES